MMTDPPLWMSTVDDVLPRACFDQVNTLIAVDESAEVAVQVRVKLLEGGTSITDIWAGMIDADIGTPANISIIKG